MKEDRLEVTPNTEFSSEGGVGGPFNPALKSYTVTNVGSSLLHYIVVSTTSWVGFEESGPVLCLALPPGVEISVVHRTCGSLEPGESEIVTVSLTADAETLGVGTHEDTVFFLNADTSLDQASRAVTLNVVETPGTLDVTPVDDFSSEGVKGGPFSPDSKAYLVANIGETTVSFTVFATQDWVSLLNESRTGPFPCTRSAEATAVTCGTLAPGESHQIRVGLTSEAENLGVGEYADPVQFDNLTTGLGETSRSVHLAVQDPSHTPEGNQVEVSPEDATTGEPSSVTLTFDTVTTAGETTVATSSTGPPPPLGLKLGNPPTYYEIDTTAGFSGSVEICIHYAGISFGNESRLKLMHFDGTRWVDITTSLDTDNDIICGTTTHFSTFVLFEPDPFEFIGFNKPVDNPPVFNVGKAGRT
ncbi:MAG: hypothetical protein GWO44_00415, partial [Thermoplasmata archaeon]|nr:hypothetical protein [Thermoplasmata archaeon]NIY01759.1 hypothetical protein [Thermoplasmata archaeon]